MLDALLKALKQFSDPRLRSVVWLGIAAAALVFGLLFWAIGWLLSGVSLTDLGLSPETASPFEYPFRLLVDVLGGLAVLGLTWLLFPVVATAVSGIFLDRVAVAVEDRHYPGLPAAREQGIVEAVAMAARFLALSLLLNLLALPVYLLLPAVNFLLFYLLNGYLIGREYFEQAALRRLDPAEAAALRKRYGARIVTLGALFAFLMTIPLVNLVAPVFATAAMIHLFEGLRRQANPA
jgi:CysZ protein